MRVVLMFLVIPVILASEVPRLAAQARPAWVPPADQRARSLEGTRDTARARYQPGDRFVLRTLAGTGVGFLGGLVGGIVLGLAVPDCRGCEDPGLTETVTGWLLGWTAGSALGAAGPGLGAQCPYAQRLWRGAAGAALGSVVALAALSGAGGADKGAWLLLATPVGASLGVMSCG